MMAGSGDRATYGKITKTTLHEPASLTALLGKVSQKEKQALPQRCGRAEFWEEHR
jgi:hypothetical protein